MTRSKHTEAQIIAALKRSKQAGRLRMWRAWGVSKHPIYAWKERFGGIRSSEVQKVRAPEDENGQLKRLVANLSPDRKILKAVIAKSA